MIKAISLIFEPAAAWDKIVLAQKSFKQVLFFFLVPLIFISMAVELAGIIQLGRHIDSGATVKVPMNRVMLYAGVELVFNFAVVLIGAKMIKSACETFHKRHNFTHPFIVSAYALSPLFLLHVFDALPGMSPWATFGIGIALAVTTLYYGVPRVLQPDPPNAFGIYVISALMLIGVAALARFLSLLILMGNIKRFSPGGLLS